MVRASDKAMEDYKRFGIEPVLSPKPMNASAEVYAGKSKK
jgi:hypothetical protein